MLTFKLICLFEAITPSLGKIPLNVEYTFETASKYNEPIASADFNSELYFSIFMLKGDFWFTTPLTFIFSPNLKGIKVSSRYNSKLSLQESRTVSQAFELFFVHLSGEFSGLKFKSGRITL